MRRIVALAVVVIVIVALKLVSRAPDSDELKKEMIGQLHKMSTYAADAAFIDRTFERAHHSAYELAYTLGDQKRPADLRRAAYVKDLFDFMINESHAARKTALAEELRTLQAKLATPAPGP